MRFHRTVLLGLFLAGCAGSHGFDRDAMRNALDHATVPDAPESGHGAAVESPPTPLPFRLAVYFVQRDFPAHRTIRKAEWGSADYDRLANRLGVLKDKRLAKDMFLLVDATIRGRDVPKIRQAAGRYGGDVVLILDGMAAVDRYNNGYALLYPTLIGAYVAPGTESDALFMIKGSLWDVRTGRLRTVQTSEGRAKSIGSAAAVDDRDVVAQAKQAALDEFGGRIVESLLDLRDTPAVPEDRFR